MADVSRFDEGEQLYEEVGGINAWMSRMVDPANRSRRDVQFYDWLVNNFPWMRDALRAAGREDCYSPTVFAASGKHVRKPCGRCSSCLAKKSPKKPSQTGSTE